MKKELIKDYVLTCEHGILSLNENCNKYTTIKKDINRLINTLVKRYKTKSHYITRKSHYLINENTKRINQIEIIAPNKTYEKVKTYLSKGNYCCLYLEDLK